MATLWSDFKQKVLELIFSYTKKGVVITSSNNQDYILQMPNRYNEAVKQLLDMRPNVYKYESVQNIPENLISGGVISGDTLINNNSGMSGELLTFSPRKVVDTGDDIYTVENPKSYYFECAGGYTDVFIEKEENDGTWSTVENIAETGTVGFKVHKGVITDDGNYRIRFTINATYPYNYIYRNVAFYADAFALADDVVPYTPYVKYDVKSLLSGLSDPYKFRRFASTQPPIILEGTELSNGNARVNPLYYIEGDSVLYIKREYSGQIIIYYETLPRLITADTALSFELEQPDELIDIASLYVASVIIGEDDANMSIKYLEMYDLRKNELSIKPEEQGNYEFISTTGW